MSIMTEKTTPQTRPWSDLPSELLSTIVDHLGIIEFLGFRGTCKAWRSASSSGSAKVESLPNRKPWFILQDENSQCVLYDQTIKTKYTMDIPELNGATCLASNHGWLLIFQNGSIFFFCPFSSAKIELPQFPHPEISDHVAALSAPPTSEDCTVCIINRRDQFIMELHVLHRGAETWNKIDYPCSLLSLDVITGAIYTEGIFHFLDGKAKLLTYCVRKKKWTIYRIIERNPNSSADELQFAYNVCYFKSMDMKTCLELEDNVSISTCGTLVPGKVFDTLINNENIRAVEESESRQLKGIWIQPRFLQIPPNQSWSLR